MHNYVFISEKPHRYCIHLGCSLIIFCFLFTSLSHMEVELRFIHIKQGLVQLPKHRIPVPFSVLDLFLSVLQFLFQNYTGLLKPLWPKYHTCEMAYIL